MTRRFIMAIALTLAAAGQADEFFVTLYETANHARQAEPFVLSGANVLEAWGDAVDTRSIRLADADGRSVPVQVDERDGGLGFTSTPNHILDPDDEIVWQADVPAGGSHRYRLYLATDPQAEPALGETDLVVAPNAQPDVHSADLVMANSAMEIGVRGQPQPESPWRDGGAAAITWFRLFGEAQVNPREWPSWALNYESFLSEKYGPAEVVATGPVRAIVQLRTPAFSGKHEGRYGRYEICVENARSVREYALYNGIPWLVCRETLVADRIGPPGFRVGSRFIWRPGGSPFNPETRMVVPDRDGTIREFTPDDEPFGTRIVDPQGAWFAALRPDGQGVPAFFFDPDKTWRLEAWSYQPNMKAHYAANPQSSSGMRSYGEIFYTDPDAAARGWSRWSWAIWGTQVRNPEDVQREYDARVRRPLTDVPPERPARIDEELAAAAAVAEERLRLLDRYRQEANGAVPAALQTALAEDARRLDRFAQTFLQDWEALSLPARRDASEAWTAWRDRAPRPEVWMQQFEFFADAGRGKGYRVLTTDNLHKVHRNLRSPGTLAGPVDLQVARNEGESVQLAVVPVGSQLTNVAVRPGELAGENGARLAPETWRRFLVGEVSPPDRVNEDVGYPPETRWPDPLLPWENFDCPPDQARAVLLTLDVPATTPPGVYRGRIIVQPEGLAPTAIPVTVRVLHFTLPVKRTLVWDSWYQLDLITHFDGNRHRPLEHWQRDVAMLARYRAVVGIQGYRRLGQEVSIWREPDGALTFDFSRLDPWIEASRPYANFWNPNFACIQGWLDALNTAHLRKMVRDRETGELLTLDDFPERSAINPEFSLLYERFMQAYVAHLREKGWLDDAWFEQWDEPSPTASPHRAQGLLEHHPYLMEIVPDLKLMAWGLRPHTDAWATGKVHAWAPHLGAWTDQQPELDQRRALGEPVFTYTCGGAYDTGLDPTIMNPDINIWDGNIQRRVYGWLYWRLKPDALLTFMMTSSYDRKNLGRRPDQWEVDRRNTWWLIYPTPEDDMWPSLRLDALRDGFEDYEYLHAAATLLEQNPNPELAELLNVEDLVADTNIYALDGAVYRARIANIARYLEKAYAPNPPPILKP